MFPKGQETCQVPLEGGRLNGQQAQEKMPSGPWGAHHEALIRHTRLHG